VAEITLYQCVQCIRATNFVWPKLGIWNDRQCVCVIGPGQQVKRAHTSCFVQRTNITIRLLLLLLLL